MIVRSDHPALASKPASTLSLSLDLVRQTRQESDTLSWYGFYPEDRAIMILGRFHSKRTRTYFPSNTFFPPRAPSSRKDLGT